MSTSDSNILTNRTERRGLKIAIVLGSFYINPDWAAWLVNFLKNYNSFALDMSKVFRAAKIHVIYQINVFLSTWSLSLLISHSLFKELISAFVFCYSFFILIMLSEVLVWEWIITNLTILCRDNLKVGISGLIPIINHYPLPFFLFYGDENGVISCQWIM